MNLNHSLLSAALALCCLIPAKGQVLINEVMQSCVYSMMDDLNDFPDSWLELYNAGDEAVSLAGYRLHTKDKFKSAYKLPATVLAPGAYAIVYCDKVGEGLHADFRIDSGKSNIYLFDADGNIVDQVALKKQPAPEVAYGRKSDGADKWGYELTPTPGTSNHGGTSDVVLGAVGFSTPGGVWSQARNLEVTLSLPDNAPADATIIYTLDGAEPVLGKALVYSSPLNVTESTVIRAKAVADGCVSVPSNVESYIFLGREFSIPVISIAVNDEYLYDENIGILVNGNGGDLNENWRKEWRRPINIEYFGAEGVKASINQLGETRVHGGMSRTNALKSLAVYANKRFGNKNFACALWPQDKPELQACKSFILRSGGNDFDGCYMRDGLIQRVIGRNTNVDWQAYSPAVVYVNGKYHAMLAIRERSNEDYVDANYNGLEDIDMFENWNELKAGDEAAAREFSDFVYADNDYEQWAEYINLESFANLMAINYWVYNADFPMNNVIMWRNVTKDADNRWQWIVKDCDYGVGLWNQMDFVERNFHDFLYSNAGPYVGFDIYQRLMRTDFRQYFIDHLVVYAGDFLNARTFNKYIDEIMESAGAEMALSHDKWGSSWSNFGYNVEFMRGWIDEREAFMPTLMQDWGLGKPVKVSVNQGLQAENIVDLGITYDGIALTQGTFDGNDYVGRTIELAAADESVIGWSVAIGGESSQVMQPMLTLEIDSESEIVVNAILKTTGAQASVAAQPLAITGGTVYADGLIEVFDATGRKVCDGNNALTLPKGGIYVVRAAGQVSKVIR